MRIAQFVAVLLFIFAREAKAQVTVTVDAAANAHPISPLIYGMNFATAAQAKAAPIPLTRWGGNSTTRYNYQLDMTNTGNDYYFENVAGCWNGAANYCSQPPKDPQAQSGANAFLTAAAQLQMATLFTIPTIGWVAKEVKYAHPFDCGCPKTALANQDSFDQYDTNCGNGKLNGAWLQCPAATGTSTAVDTTFANGWVKYLTTQYGPSAGRRIYALDNEPNLWSSTHHDVHPIALTYDELWQRMLGSSLAILAADPSAEVSGPVEWGWPDYFCSDADNISQGCFPTSPDRAKHNGEELTAWLLDQAAAYEQTNHQRVLHYLDLHYYPQSDNPPANTRSLWDPSYTDPSWINAEIRLIPRMRDWVNQHYPGTKLIISEYDFGHHNEPVGAVTYAEILGIFGRESLDAATAWSPPAETDAAFAAYALYLNYDNKGAHFESQSASTTVTGATTVNAYAATGTTGATVVLVNEANAAATIAVTFQNFAPEAVAHWYTASGASITAQPDVTLSGGQATVTLPATGIGLLAVPGVGPAVPDMAVTPDGSSGDLAASATVDAHGEDAAAQSGDADVRLSTAGGGCSCEVGGVNSRRAENWWLGAAVLGLAVVVSRWRGIRRGAPALK